MKGNFVRYLPMILQFEGGWSDNPDDPGGPTMKGITIGTYRQWKGKPVTKADLRAISDDEVASIYRRNYWDKVKGDDLPAGLDLVAFDAAVNSGPSRAAKWLQAAIGVEADGKIGPQTLAAANGTELSGAITRACDARLAFMKGLKTWPEFKGGWQKRVDGVRREAIAMARLPATPEKIAVEPRPAPAAPSRPEPATLPPAAKKPGPAGIVAVVLAILGGVALVWDKIAAWFGG